MRKAEEPEDEWRNRAEIEHVRGCSRVTGLVYESPLKIFEVGVPSPGEPARIVLSNYGGGMLQGDRVGLRLLARQNSKTVLGSQANTHIYRNEKGVESEFHLDGRLEEGSTFVFNAEPVVLHRDAMYRQSFSWNLHPSSRLMFVDWFQSGRSENGEAYEFTSFHSCLDIYIGGVPVLKERFRCIPRIDMPRNAAMFMGYNQMVNIYCAGFVPELPRFSFREISKVPSFHQSGKSTRGQMTAASYLLPEINGAVVRVLAKRRLDLGPVLNWLEKEAVHAGVKD